MLRLFYFLAFFLCAVMPASSYAQDAAPPNAPKVRAGEQDGYSRLVFDWGKPVTYSITKSADKLVIRFAQPGSVSAAIKANNIESLSVLSQTPLEVAVTIPKNSKERDFQAGNRIIIDIYDPTGVKREPAKTAEKTPPKTEPKKEEPVKTAAAEPPREEPKKEEPKKEEPKGPPATPVKNMLKDAPPAASAAVEAVIGADLPPPSSPADKMLEIVQPAAVSADSQKALDPQRPSNLITLSSIDALGMAVFIRDNKIWLIADKQDLMLTPQVSGPEANYFTPVETVELDGGKIYRVRMMDDANVRGQGGGLLWRIVVPAGPSKTKPVRPVRITESVAPATPAAHGAAPPKKEKGAKIVWPFGDARAIYKINDPETGRDIISVTMGAAKLYAGPAMKFIDFETINSPVGITILPKVDDLDVEITNQGDVMVSRPGGLSLTSEDTLASIESSSQKVIAPGSQANAKRVFDFRNWQMGGIETTDDNRNVIMSQIGGLTGGDRVEGLLTLGKMYLANGMWAEAKGFLDLAAEEMPELNQNSAYIALHGASQALGYESEEAFKDLSNGELKVYPEIGYWRAFALADLGDWQQADQVFPDELYILSEYSPQVKMRLSLTLAEVALRAGDTAKGEQLLGFAEDFKGQLNSQQLAAMDYLKGEAARQRNKIPDTKKFWQPLAKGKDDMYRAKAGLALTRLLAEKKEMPGDKVIDNLERLRYAWRGDDLEAQIAYWLGRSYFDNKDFVKGLIIMRDAATFAEGTDVGRRIITEMTEVFKKLFLGPDLDKVSALDAAALHEQYEVYLPTGTERDKIAERLAERLVKADLLDKAAALLQSQVSHLTPAEAYRVTARVAAIHLIDDKPSKAWAALDEAAKIYPTMPVELRTPQRDIEIPLLRARALSEQEKFEQALALLNALPRGPDVNKLRADIAWHAGYWDEAAIALENVIVDRNISLTRPLDATNTALILQRAVALNLANDRVGLAGLREQFLDVMAQTDKAKIFEVVTRPRQSAALADRNTLMSVVSEVDLFKEFLDSYRAEPAPEAPATAANATPPAPAPATPAPAVPETAAPPPVEPAAEPAPATEATSE